MNDLVDQLRLVAGKIVDVDDHVVVHLAADEIERLRVGWLDQAARDAREIVRLEVEIERLKGRAA